MSYSTILKMVRQYYEEKFETYGATPRGVDWNSQESQDLRFEQLLKIYDCTTDFSINDYGCGYGALVEYMNDRGYIYKYQGFDVSENMITKAMELHKGHNHCKFSADSSSLTLADYTVASGIFNVKMSYPEKEWYEYVITELDGINLISRKGFSFNILTKYSDKQFMKDNLYYADPCIFFDFCKRRYAKKVALLHDYDLYEFTILVRKAT